MPRGRLGRAALAEGAAGQIVTLSPCVDRSPSESRSLGWFQIRNPP